MQILCIGGWSDEKGVRWNAFYKRNAKTLKSAMDSVFLDMQTIFEPDSTIFRYFSASAGIPGSIIENDIPLRAATYGELRGHGKALRNGVVFVCNSEGLSECWHIKNSCITKSPWEIQNAASWVNLINSNEKTNRSLGV